MGGGFGFGEVPIGIAIDGQAGGAIERGAALRSRAAQGDIFISLENLDLRQRQVLFLAG